MSEKYGAAELKLFDEIEKGRTFDRGETLPAFYKEKLINLLWMQGDSEYSGCMGYVPWIDKAPSVTEKVLVAQIVKDEMRHASVIYKLLNDLGEDTTSHIANTDMAYKLEEDEVNIGFKRLKEDFRVNIFYYNIKYWTDFNLFNFLMDRAAGHQLEDTLKSSFTPWKEGIAGIYKEEIMHVAHGDKWIKILAEDPKEKDFLQKRLNLWWPRVMNVFGGQKGATNDVYVKLGLKQRTNQEVRTTFIQEIKSMIAPLGLTIPEWKEAEQPR